MKTQTIVVALAAVAASALTFAAPPPSVRAAIGRKAFLRCEADAKLPIEIVCDKKGDVITNAVLVVRQFVESDQIAVTTLDVPEIVSGEKGTVLAPVETRLRPGKTLLTVALETKAGVRLYWCPVPIELTIARRLGDNLPIVLDDSYDYYPAFAELGFTRCKGDRVMQRSGYSRNLKPTEAERIKAFKEFDEVFASGLEFGFSQPFMYPVGKDPKQFYRRQRDGSTARDNVYKGPYPEVSQPAMQDFAREISRFFIKEFGSHPAFKEVLFCSEMRDSSFPSFNTEHLKFKAETGLDYPERTGAETNEEWHAWAKKRFAATKGVVPENDPFYVCKTWQLAGGDGWPAFLSAAYDEYHQGMKDPDFMTRWDPAVRCPPAWTSGGNCRLLANWVYAVPEPMAVAGPTEETFAMARGRRPAQKVQAQTQLICYRRSLAPVQETVKEEPAWFKTHPKAAFMTIPPDALREATWFMISKPVSEVVYYGFETVIETGTDWYACTEPASYGVLKDLCWNVLRPLGPTLKRLGRKPQKVAVLESATSVMFGGHHQFGWQSEYVMHAQRAGLDPRVIYEEEILRDGTDGIDVIYAPHFVFTTQKILDALNAFRKRGGLLVLDSDHLAAIEPDVLSPDGVIWNVPKIDQPEGIEEATALASGNVDKRIETAHEKTLKLKNAQILRERLAAKGFRPEVDSSSPEIIVASRQHGDIPYVFAMNDKRTFGDYVGAWGHMMEKGLPIEGEVTIKDPGFKNLVVYELSRGGRVDVSRKDGLVHVPVKYETTDGRLFVFAEEAIERVALDGKVKVEGQGQQRMLSVQMKVLGASGKPMKGLWPVEVCVIDAAGNKIDGIDYGCAVDGVFTASVPLNLNDAKGVYTVTCRDRASGLTKSEIVK